MSNGKQEQNLCELGMRQITRERAILIFTYRIKK